MSNLRKLQLIVIVALVLCLLTGCGAKADKSAPAEAELSEEEIFGAAPEETPGLPLATPYIQLFYPEEWEGYVTISQQDSEKSHAISFSVELSGQNVEMFTILLSPDEQDGFLLGTLKDKAEGKIKVYTVMNESVEGLSEADFNEFCALQERVNDFIVQFYNDARFTPGK